jgi:hypothetical protein
MPRQPACRVAQFGDLRLAGKALGPSIGDGTVILKGTQENYVTPADTNMKFLDPLHFFLKASCEQAGFLAYAI